eukprot:gnl/Ergobibamus_cyprinoides/29.p1 GENE.gnl/Ergobibamus_cyprinoides/29~~gnl/Ergobibamus_cyprinoides/29.p1  ORF type:complete len:555 (-),score=203.26 gnl/Ergobibamus_cyprinoides/29:16-1527(-)
MGLLASITDKALGKPGKSLTAQLKRERDAMAAKIEDQLPKLEYKNDMLHHQAVPHESKVKIPCQARLLVAPKLPANYPTPAFMSEADPLRKLVPEGIAKLQEMFASIMGASISELESEAFKAVSTVRAIVEGELSLPSALAVAIEVDHALSLGGTRPSTPPSDPRPSTPAAPKGKSPFADAAAAAAEFQASGGLEALLKTREQIADLERQCGEISQQATDVLRAEIAADASMVATWGPRYNSQQFQAICNALTADGDALRTKLGIAADANVRVDAKLSANTDILSAAAHAQEDVLARLSAAERSDAAQTIDESQPRVIAARAVEAALSELLARRHAVEEAVTALKTHIAGDSITEQAVTSGLAPGDDGSLSDRQQAVFDVIVAKATAAYGPDIQMLKDACTALQVEGVACVREAHAAFLEAQKKHEAAMAARRSGEADSGQKAMEDIQSAMTVFRELSSNLKEGLSFYQAMQARLRDLERRCGEVAATHRRELARAQAVLLSM